MGDLISRSDVINLINNFNFVGYQEPNAEVREEFSKEVEKIPTAYDVDKVVKAVSDISSWVRPVGWSTKQEIVLTKDAIEKIEAGGVNG